MNRIRFAIDMILQKKLNFILSVMLTGVGFFLIGFTLLVYLAGNFSKESADNVLSQGIGQTGIMDIDFGFCFDLDLYASANEFRKEAFESERIHSIGSVQYFMLERKYFTELYEIQKEKKDIQEPDSVQSQYVNTEDALRVLEVDLEVFNISDLSLEDGVAPQNLEYSDPDIQYLYLGYAYHDIPVGTQFVYEQNDEDETKIVYEVAGIIEKGEKYVSAELSGYIDFATVRNDVNTDYEIICLRCGYPSFPWLFSVDKKYSVDEGMKELEKIADRYGFKIQQYLLQDVFDIAGAQTAIIQESLLDVLFCMVIVIVVVVTTLQIVQIYHCSRQYGILYAVGFSTADMQWMLIVRNVICFVLSICVGIVFLIFVGQKFFVRDLPAKELFFELLSYRVLPVDLILMGILFFVVSFIPCRMFHRMDPVKLIQGE